MRWGLAGWALPGAAARRSIGWRCASASARSACSGGDAAGFARCLSPPAGPARAICRRRRADLPADVVGQGGSPGMSDAARADAGVPSEPPSAATSWRAATAAALDRRLQQPRANVVPARGRVAGGGACRTVHRRSRAGQRHGRPPGSPRRRPDGRRLLPAGRQHAGGRPRRHRCAAAGRALGPRAAASGRDRRRRRRRYRVGDLALSPASPRPAR